MPNFKFWFQFDEWLEFFWENTELVVMIYQVSVYPDDILSGRISKGFDMVIVTEDMEDLERWV